MTSTSLPGGSIESADSNFDTSMLLFPVESSTFVTEILELSFRSCETIIETCENRRIATSLPFL
jgi:hypothetical protein